MLPNNLAAIRLGAEEGLAITKYASAADLQELRAAGSPVTPPHPVAAPAVTAQAARGRPQPRASRARNKGSDTTVFVVHGRDEAARNDMFDFLRALGLRPLEWMEAIKFTRKPMPYIGDILKTAFEHAEAVVVLMTPDDYAYLRKDLQKRHDKPFEKKPTGQARPNVIFEAGLAFATHPDKTVLVEMGQIREFSDIAGRHIQRMSGSAADRTALATRLRNAGCKVNTDGQDWLTVGSFADPLKIIRAKTRKKR